MEIRVRLGDFERSRFPNQRVDLDIYELYCSSHILISELEDVDLLIREWICDSYLLNASVHIPIYPDLSNSLERQGSLRMIWTAGTKNLSSSIIEATQGL